MMNWIDVETTGLDPDTNYLLEIGLIVTDDRLVEVSRTSLLTGAAPINQLMSSCNNFVRDMHTKSGLWEDLRQNGGMYTAHAENLLRELVVKGAPICGNSVHFDRAWLKEEMPRLEADMDYHNIDVSSVRELHRRFRPEAKPFKHTGNHRVLADLDSSIAELRYYMNDMGWRKNA